MSVMANSLNMRLVHFGIIKHFFLHYIWTIYGYKLCVWMVWWFPYLIGYPYSICFFWFHTFIFWLQSKWMVLYRQIKIFCIIEPLFFAHKKQTHLSFGHWAGYQMKHKINKCIKWSCSKLLLTFYKKELVTYRIFSPFSHQGPDSSPNWNVHIGTIIGL